MKPPTCKVCGGYCFLGQAIRNQDVKTMPDEAGNATIYEQAGPPIMQDVLKCEDCGHSFVPLKPGDKIRRRIAVNGPLLNAIVTKVDGDKIYVEGLTNPINKRDCHPTRDQVLGFLPLKSLKHDNT